MPSESQRSTKKIVIPLIILICLAGAGLGWYFFIGKGKKAGGSETNTVITSSVVSVEEVTPENSTFSFNKDIFPPQTITPISNFEESEDVKWQGEALFDSKVFFEGERSLALISIDRKEAVAYAKTNIDLANAEYIEFMGNISDQSAFETLTLKLGDVELQSYFEYTFSNLSQGWNLIRIPKDQFVPVVQEGSEFSWARIERVQFASRSRFDAVLTVQVDMLKAVNQSYELGKAWRVSDNQKDKFLSLYSKNGATPQLMARNMGISRAVLNDLKNEDDVIYSVDVSPQSLSKSGLFIRGNYNNGYGYYFVIGGVGNNSWEVLKYNSSGWVSLDTGDFGNTTFQDDKNYTMRVEARGPELDFFFSYDGKEYIQVAEVKDSEFRSGGLGITVLEGKSWSLFDNFLVKEL